VVEFIRHRTNLFYKKGSKLKKQFSPQNSKARRAKKERGRGKGNFCPPCLLPAAGGLIRLPPPPRLRRVNFFKPRLFFVPILLARRLRLNSGLKIKS